MTLQSFRKEKQCLYQLGVKKTLMSETNKKILPVINPTSSSNQHSPSRKTPSNPNHEIQLGCGCCSTPCEGCGGALGIKIGSEKDVVYRNVAIYLSIAVVIILGTFVAQRILTVLSAGLT